MTFPIVLASASPRRRRLLQAIFPEFEAVSPDVDEDSLTLLDPFETAVRLAEAKAAAVERPDALVIAGDTVVAYEEADGWVQLAKPIDEEDAFRMLRTLSGRTHTVVTGLALRWPGGAHAFHESARVTFQDVSDDQIRAYIATGEPMDKAGAYGFQGEGGAFVQRIEGDPLTVVGLPVERLRAELARFGLLQ